MSGTKIIVIQLKELIYTTIFAVLGLILIGILIFMLIPKEKEPAAAIYEPGVYTSSFMLHNKAVNVEVTVSTNKITSIQLVDLQPEQEVFYPLVQPTMETLTKEILASQSLDVATASESAVTSRVLLQAIENAISKAYTHAAE